MAFAVQLRGLPTALARLERERKSGEQMRQRRVEIGSSLVYAFGSETGRSRRGRLARAAGGAWMLSRGLADTRPEIAAALQTARRGAAGTVQGRDLLLALAYRVLARAQRYTPVRTGTLRRSLRVAERA